ncbi:TetR/AcrR family transcriptional regulator [Priestia flexa]|uniref:TetR/AcrR family transcriptional regulator n=1 Tax=Priestia flexa TaxID=86664 RepID=UPI001B32B3A6|nr:TetR/AcrR family transcriptional regulator [Priestia flexa]
MQRKEDKKKHILEAAIAVFAEEGYQYSLRKVTAIAGVNVAAVNYYFGSKQELSKALVHEVYTSLNEQQLKNIRELSHPSTREIVFAFCSPYWDLYQQKTEESQQRLKVVHQVFIDPNPELRDIVFNMISNLYPLYYQALQKNSPHLSNNEVWWRLLNLGGVTLMNLTGQLSFPPKLDIDVTEEDEKKLEWILTFLTAGLSA